MTTVVEEKNRLTIPAEIAAEFNITPGTRLEWTHSANGIVIRPVSNPVHLAEKLYGAGRKFLKPGDDPIGDLLRDRARERQDEEAAGQ